MRLALEEISYYKKHNPRVKDGNILSALDLRCGIDKTSFYLATFFGKDLGLDYSKRFIEICDVLKEKGEYNYQILSNGENYTKAKARIPDNIERSRLEFVIGDAMNLPHLISPFDIIVASNLIDRLINPLEC